MSQNDKLTGTISELVADGKLTINGVPVGQPEMSVLTRLGFAKEIGTVERPEVAEGEKRKRGPAAKIWEIPLNGSFAVARK